MKRIFCVFLAFVFMSGCATETEIPVITETATLKSEEIENIQSDNEFVGLWIPIYEISPEGNCNADTYADKVSSMLEAVADFGFTDIFVQVRANCDSIYPSGYFSPAKQFSAGGELKFDALQIIVNEAHEYNLKIHAWINPYRVSSNAEYDKNNAVFRCVSSEDIVVGENWSYIRPSSTSGRRLILEGVREIIENYNIDGIHIDDYFYPTTDVEFDKTDYENYASGGGRLPLDEWRRENVNILISSMYALIKNCDNGLLFSISPCGDIDKNFNKLYADVEMWCRCPGFADMIIPQIYYGFENSAQPFEKCLSEWIGTEIDESVKLVIGLAAYKIGKNDEYAGGGKKEWRDNDDILKRQVEIIRSKALDGFALFSYNYIFGNSYFKNNEIIALKEVL